MHNHFMTRLQQMPLRTRLTLWYLLALLLILSLLSAFLYWQVQRLLISQMDTALRLAATQALVTVEAERSGLAFQNAADSEARIRQLSDDFAIYLLAEDNVVWDDLGYEDEFRPQIPQPGFTTIQYEDDLWRVYSERIASEGEAPGGWLQVAQEMDLVAETLVNLRGQVVLGLPLALLLAGFVGYFLAGRALQPIEKITQTARTINAGDLSQRIEYIGPADEVGRLAATFDDMLTRLQAAFDRERRFTGDAAHELRTPLTALKGRLEVTLNRPREAAEYVRTLRELEQQVDRLIRLSSDLLFMVRLDAQRRAQQVEPLELKEILAAVLDQVQPLARQNQVTITRQLATNLIIQADLDLMFRLFLNLLDNAVKYTMPGGRVDVTSEFEQNEAVITISDTGPGIPAEHIPHLFERFYRVEGDRGRQAGSHRGGTGLGLAIAAEIIRAHNGTIQVSSVMGEGSTFTVQLPRTDSG